MDPQEMRDKIMAAINGLIKGEPESEKESETNIHDVLAAKMRDRINPPTEPVVDLDAPTDDDPPADPPAGE